MGIFSDLFGSSSHTQQTTSTSQVTNTQLAGGNISAPTVYGTGNRQNVTVYSTDSGAIASATDISRAALELGAQEANTGSAVAIAGLAHAGNAYTSSLQFAGGVTHDALTGNTAIAQDAIASASDALNSSLQAVVPYAGKALDSVTRFAGASLDSNTYIAGKSLDSTNQAYNAALGQVNALAQQVSQSSQQATDQTVKSIILYLVLGVAVVVIAKK